MKVDAADGQGGLNEDALVLDAEHEHGAGADVTFSEWPAHAERLIWDKLSAEGVDPNQVTRIYTEYQPCSIPTVAAGCDTWINKTFLKARVTYSFEYGDQASRDAGRAARASDFASRFGPKFE